MTHTIETGEFEAGSGSLKVQPFGGGVRLRFNDKTDFYFLADGTFDGTGNVIDPSFVLPVVDVDEPNTD